MIHLPEYPTVLPVSYMGTELPPGPASPLEPMSPDREQRIRETFDIVRADLAHGCLAHRRSTRIYEYWGAHDGEFRRRLSHATHRLHHAAGLRAEANLVWLRAAEQFRRLTYGLGEEARLDDSRYADDVSKRRLASVEIHYFVCDELTFERTSFRSWRPAKPKSDEDGDR